jgi:hypothetical protein
MRAEIEILERNTDFTSNNTVTRAVAKAVKVMRAWEELRAWVPVGLKVIWTSGENEILNKMDSLVPPEPTDELDELHHWVLDKIIGISCSDILTKALAAKVHELKTRKKP